MVRAPLSYGAVILALLASAGASSSEEVPRCARMQLPVERVEGRPSQYDAFCERYPHTCILDGEPVVEWSAEIHRRLGELNAVVNDEIEFVSDMDNLGLEEHWDFPQNCRGDCEDFVLEKRERLVDLALPRASMTIAFAIHEVKLFLHAVLLVETTEGTWVLDNLDDEVLCWDAVPYRYLRRERPDGSWARFSRP